MAQEIPSRLEELVPRALLETLQRNFAALTGVPMAFTDPQGRPLTAIERPLCFCGSLLRDVPGALCLRRAKWDVPEPEIEDELLARDAEGKPVAHRCRGGFRDTAVPVLVGGQILGYAIFARALAEEPDRAHFRSLATEAGMPPEAGDEVVDAAVVMPRERIAQVAELLQVLAGLVATAAYDSVRARQITELEGLRDSLVHMIVHDLRTPLTAVIGGLQTIIDTEYDPELTREFVPSALDSANTLLEMVNTLLDVNKMESGRMELELVELDVPEVVAQAVAQVKGLAEARGQQLQVSVTGDCAGIIADREKLLRVVVNLVSNAAKFTPDGGAITVTSTCDAEGLTLSVADNGPGIPEEYRERIFEKFGQVEGRKSKIASTGLGLTFCKMVAEAHGGRIWVDSVVGEGSNFQVFIPRRRP